MLQNIRDNSQGLIAKTIIGVIVLLLALTGFDAIFNYVRTDKLAVKVNGIKITQQELAELITANKRQLEANGSEINEQALRTEVLNGLITRTLMLQSAKNADFTVSKNMLDALIVQYPMFQEDGKFSQDLFIKFANSAGYSIMQLREMLSNDILLQQLQNSVAASSFSSKTQLESIIKLNRQTRDFAYTLIKADVDAIVPTPEELQEYYAAHQNKYDLPEQVIAEYIELNKANLYDEVNVSSEDLQKAYAAKIASLSEQRSAAHILLEVNGERDEQSAKTQINQISERIKNGEDFAALANEFSDDLITAKNGGDLGVITPDEQHPAFEQALYALAVNEVSDPVRTDYGWHLIKATKIVAPKIPKLEDLQAELELELKDNLADQLFIERSTELANLVYEASDLNQPAAQLNLTVQTSDPITKEGASGIFALPKIINALFSEEVISGIANSAVIEVSPDAVAVVRVKDHFAQRSQEFAAVQNEVIADFKLQQATKNAQDKATDLLSKLKQGEQTNLAWQELTAQTRRALPVNNEILALQNPDIWQQVMDVVFSMPKTNSAQNAQFASLNLVGGDLVLLKLNNVNEFDPSTLSEQELAAYRYAMSQYQAGQEFALFVKGLEQSAKIEHF